MVLLSVLKRVADKLFKRDDAVALDLLRINEGRMLLSKHSCGGNVMSIHRL